MPDPSNANAPCGLCAGTRRIKRLDGFGQPQPFDYPCPECSKANAPCPTCDGERYDITYRGAPAEDGGPDPCPTCNGSGTTERRPDPDYSCEALCMDQCIGVCGVL